MLAVVTHLTVSHSLVPVVEASTISISSDSSSSVATAAAFFEALETFAGGFAVDLEAAVRVFFVGFFFLPSARAMRSLASISFLGDGGGDSGVGGERAFFDRVDMFRRRSNLVVAGEKVLDRERPFGEIFRSPQKRNRNRNERNWLSSSRAASKISIVSAF